ncbi:hypothetical protein GTNG_3105 [Geobacillus thermodenitrificans NG80-2]|uniref:Uncharacterized protein n=1 Tax=Geobacillus thermodenitrificans (strain NG80-2) TaxID=420246 RepID=A4ISZ6_GEOTN|nr:hypothetical protein GTNG_3105 [Geobacillus thermodenitrificans NG80-2]
MTKVLPLRSIVGKQDVSFHRHPARRMMIESKTEHKKGTLMLKVLRNHRYQKRAIFTGFLDSSWLPNEKARPRISSSCSISLYQSAAAKSNCQRLGCAAALFPCQNRRFYRSKYSWL